ncbi:NUDIX domain-containing protein [Saccharomonospora sp. CUA-673]|uniref:NUDIX hydrolase n=1 Tax=Saccharomonospora sp. CUA-673 TaxID=1904969 RepID=UPI000AA5D12B|nr:NUDIX hydrolase [Saccharomonospora sp. CUA-673]
MTGEATTYPVSVKGVVIHDGRVLLLHNERDEWELPGGRIEPGESPEECVVREIAEETRLLVRANELLDAWTYHIDAVGRSVFIVTYGCTLVEDGAPVVSPEHDAAELFSPTDVATLRMPDGYKRSITTWFEMNAR